MVGWVDAEHVPRERRSREALGDHVFDHFVAAKRQEWRDYIMRISDWELESYLLKY